ncbi:hypothetical protein [Pelagibacterium sp.]|uniref:hypothetical protein n=1 Tax=Pelagibacterium sp. TaxID=1967288 RepID=UPI003A908DC8
MLEDRVRQVLINLAKASTPITYKALADQLELVPPRTIQRVARALEDLMVEDAMAGRPLLAALCVRRQPMTTPARGFFIAAKALGLFSGSPDGQDARDFHEREYARAIAYYGRSDA